MFARRTSPGNCWEDLYPGPVMARITYYKTSMYVLFYMQLFRTKSTNAKCHFADEKD
jgi:hypothetical protein